MGCDGAWSVVAARRKMVRLDSMRGAAIGIDMSVLFHAAASSKRMVSRPDGGEWTLCEAFVIGKDVAALVSDLVSRLRRFLDAGLHPLVVMDGFDKMGGKSTEQSSRAARRERARVAVDAALAGGRPPRFADVAACVSRDDEVMVQLMSALQPDFDFIVAPYQAGARCCCAWLLAARSMRRSPTRALGPNGLRVRCVHQRQ